MFDDPAPMKASVGLRTRCDVWEGFFMGEDFGVAAAGMSAGERDPDRRDLPTQRPKIVTGL